MAAKHARVEVYRGDRRVRTADVSKDLHWYWRFVATNGKIVADSAEGYHRRRWCLHGAAVALGLPMWAQHIQPGQERVVRRTGDIVRVVVLP